MFENGHDPAPEKRFAWGRSRRNGEDLGAYRRIALQLHYDLPRPDASRSVLVVSPAEPQAAAQCSLKLASCLAQELGKNVLLMDASGIGAETAKLLGCTNGNGVSELLRDPATSLDQVVHPTTQDNVWFLSAGSHAATTQATSPELTAKLLVNAQAVYDFVVICGGAVLENSLALAIAPHVGLVLLSVVEDTTSIRNLDSTRNSLERCGAAKLALVLVSSADRI